MIILIMGLPGSGKTTLAVELKNIAESNNRSVIWYNGDIVREIYDDWDFSEIGRIRQAARMRDLSLTKLYQGTSDLIICDFVAPTNVIQNLIPANKVVWVDTLRKSRYSDTNKIFEPPRLYDFRVRKKNSKLWAQIIFDNIIGSVNDSIKIN